MPAKLIAAASAGFLLAAGQAAARHRHLPRGRWRPPGRAPFGYADWAGIAVWAALGNLVGGLGLVTVLGLVQVGRVVLDEERRRPTESPEPEDDAAGREDSARAEATPS